MKNQNVKFETTTRSQLTDCAKQLIQLLKPKSLILLDGPMASGKTTFVSELVSLLGGNDVTSPTYSIHQSYTYKNGEIDHIDLYRLKSDEDLESTGFWDLFEKKKGIIIVEWASRLDGEWWPKDWEIYQLHFSNNSGIRQIVLNH